MLHVLHKAINFLITKTKTKTMSWKLWNHQLSWILLSHVSSEYSLFSSWSMLQQHDDEGFSSCLQLHNYRYYYTIAYYIYKRIAVFQLNNHIPEQVHIVPGTLCMNPAICIIKYLYAIYFVHFFILHTY